MNGGLSLEEGHLGIECTDAPVRREGRGNSSTRRSGEHWCWRRADDGRGGDVAAATVVAIVVWR